MSSRMNIRGKIFMIYEGTDPQLFTPLTGVNMNKNPTIIAEAIDHIDERLIEIEEIISSKNKTNNTNTGTDKDGDNQDYPLTSGSVVTDINVTNINFDTSIPSMKLVKHLYDMIESLNRRLENGSGGTIASVDVIDDLDNDSSTSALSANQGNQLFRMINEMNERLSKLDTGANKP